MARRTRREREEEKRKKRSRFWMGVFIIVIMVFSTLGFIATYYAPQNPGNQEGQQGAYDFSYEVRDNRVFVRHDGEEVPFYSLPQGVSVPDEASRLLSGAQGVFVAFNASDEQNLPYVELARWDFSQYLDVPTSGALLSESEQYDFPVVTCADASAQHPVVRFVNASRTGVSVDGSCVTLSGSEVGLLYARDALLYSYLGLV